jgi:aminopeptidase N
VATDVDFENIDRVVAHEYFHNWTGNRVTCRDWFQLSLKEGLTVFRDQEFGADTHNRERRRIREVRGLRAASSPRMPARWRIRCARPPSRDQQLLHRHGL